MRLVDQVFVKYAWTRLKVDETLRLNKRRYFFFFFFVEQMEIRSNELSEYNYMFSGFILFSS